MAKRTRPQSRLQIGSDPFDNPVIRARLAAEGVHSALDWRRLGRRRLQLFGIVPSVVRQLDQFAAEGSQS